MPPGSVLLHVPAACTVHTPRTSILASFSFSLLHSSLKRHSFLQTPVCPQIPITSHFPIPVEPQSASDVQTTPTLSAGAEHCFTALQSVSELQASPTLSAGAAHLFGTEQLESSTHDWFFLSSGPRHLGPVSPAVQIPSGAGLQSALVQQGRPSAGAPPVQVPGLQSAFPP